jgi:outer membrane receptor for ferrienterochelin and colicin
VNFTFVESRVTMPPELGQFDPDLALSGQSPYLINANLTWAPRARRLSASVLYNYFADRVTRYGTASQQGEGQGPNLYEAGRGQLDAKLEFGVSARGSLSLSARNLTNSRTEYYHPSASHGNVQAGYAREGVTFSVGFGYAF